MSTTPKEIIEELGFGMVPNLFSTADVNEDVQTGLWQPFRHLVLKGHLPRTVKEMMGVIISREASSLYAAQVHLHALTLQGIEEPMIEALNKGEVPQGVPEKTGLLLKFAYDAARAPHSPAPVQTLRGANFNEAEIAEAVAIVGLFRMLNTWTDVMEIPLDDL